MSTETNQQNGGVVFCWMCGFNASLTPEQRKILDARLQPWCHECREVDQMSMLTVEDDFPSDFAPDEPLLPYAAVPDAFLAINVNVGGRFKVGKQWFTVTGFKDEQTALVKAGLNSVVAMPLEVVRQAVKR